MSILQRDERRKLRAKASFGMVCGQSKVEIDSSKIMMVLLNTIDTYEKIAISEADKAKKFHERAETLDIQYRQTIHDTELTQDALANECRQHKETTSKLIEAERIITSLNQDVDELFTKNILYLGRITEIKNELQKANNTIYDLQHPKKVKKIVKKIKTSSKRLKNGRFAKKR